MQVFGQPAGANLTVTCNPLTLSSGQPYTAALHPPPYAPGVPVPHTDARWATTITLHSDNLAKLKSVTNVDNNNVFQIITVQRVIGVHYPQPV